MLTDVGIDQIAEFRVRVAVLNDYHRARHTRDETHTTRPIRERENPSVTIFAQTLPMSHRCSMAPRCVKCRKAWPGAASPTTLLQEPGPVDRCEDVSAIRRIFPAARQAGPGR